MEPAGSGSQLALPDDIVNLAEEDEGAPQAAAPPPARRLALPKRQRQDKSWWQRDVKARCTLL